MINVGLNSLSAIKVGSDTISKAYQGSTLIYDTTPSTYDYLATKYNITSTSITKVANVIQEGVTTMKVDGVEVPASTGYTFTTTGSHTIEWVGVSSSIPASGFTNVYALTEAILPSGMTTIGDSCFYGSYGYVGLTTINLDNVTQLGTYAFARSFIKEAVLGNVTSIPNYAFYGCGSLTALTPYTGAAWDAYTLPSTVTSIGDNAFSMVGVNKPLYVPSGVTTIGSGAFLGSRFGSFIKLEEGLLTIGANAFQGTMLQGIAIPSTVTYLGSGCLYSIYDVTFLSATPPQKDGDIFKLDGQGPAEVDRIYVPAGSKTAYDEAFPAYTDLIYERS